MNVEIYSLPDFAEPASCCCHGALPPAKYFTWSLKPIRSDSRVSVYGRSPFHAMARPSTDQLMDLTSLLIYFTVSLTIMVPLAGTLVRFRVNYNPKGPQLDAGGAQSYTGPVVTTFFGMLTRVYEIEVCAYVAPSDLKFILIFDRDGQVFTKDWVCPHYSWVIWYPAWPLPISAHSPLYVGYLYYWLFWGRRTSSRGFHRTEYRPHWHAGVWCIHDAIVLTQCHYNPQVNGLLFSVCVTHSKSV